MGRHCFAVLLFAVGVIFATTAKAQLQVSEAYTAATVANIVQNTFVGNCVSISNVTFTGYATPAAGGRGAFGAFTNGNTTNLGLSEGFLITTGRANNAIGPNATPNLSFNNSQPGNVDLTTITGIQTYDAAVLEFDFFPLSDTVKFRYVFASEEYPEYVDNGFNDVFGFFLSGPGINGPYQNGAINIALVPGTTLPVAIDNVNNGYHPTGPATGPCNNCQFFVENTGGSTIQYDGFTTPLVATAIVQRCHMYHIKLVIADVGDRVLDSGVFFESRSFSGGEPVQLDIQASTALNGVWEGCSDALFTFTRLDPSTINNPIYADFVISGSATMGVDYANIPAMITVPAGQMSASLVIDALVDGVPEPTETITITLDNSACGCSAPPSATVNIYNNDVQLEATSTGSTVICPGQSATLTATPSGSEGPYSISWDNGAGTGPSVTVSPSQTTTYTATVNDICFGQTVTSQEVVTVLNGAFAAVGNVQQCLVGNNFTFIPGIPVLPAQTHTWDAGDGSAPQSGPSFTHTYAQAGTFTVTHTVSNGQCSATDTLNVTVTAGTGGQVVSVTNVSCGGVNDGSATVAPTGGQGPFTYLWQPSGQTTATATNLGVGTYTVTIAGSAGCGSVLQVEIQELSAPVAVCQNVLLGLDANGTAMLDATQVYPGDPIGCGIQSIAVDVNQFNCTQIGPNTATLTVTPITGQPTTCAATITVTDDLPPVAICQNTTILLVGGVALVDAAQLAQQSTDNCGGLTFSAVPALFTCPTATPQPVTITVTDAAGHSATCVSQVTVTGQGGLQVTPVVVATVPCDGAPTGSVNVSVVGGVAPYSIAWSNGQSGNVASGLGVGPYSVLVSDASGCTASANFNMVQTGAPQVSVVVDTVYDCSGLVSASAVANVQGTGPFTFQWSGGQASGNTVLNLAPGTQSVKVTDAQGCDTTVLFVVADRLPLNVSGQMVVSPPCFGIDNGSIDLAVSGGVGPYQAVWSTSQTGTSVTGLGPGIYGVDVTDANGCLASAQFTLTQPNDLVVSIVQQTDVSCFGLANGSATVAVSGGSGGLSVDWLPSGLAGTSVTALMAGLHTATVTDASGCQRQVSVIIEQPQLLTVNAGPDTGVCAGDSTALTALATGGTAPYTYSWSNGSSESTVVVSPSAQSVFAVNVADANGCVGGPDNVMVSVLPPPTAGFTYTLSNPCEAPWNVMLSSASTPGIDVFWELPFGQTSTEPDVILTLDQPGAYNVMLMAMAGPGCADTAFDVVTVLPVPQAQGSFVQTLGCGPLEVEFNGSATNAVGLLWDFGDGQTSTLSNTAHTYALPGTYLVSLTAFSPAGCGVMQTLSPSVNLLPLAVAGFNVVAGPATEPEGTFYLINTSQSANSWFWDLGDGLTSTLQSPAHQYTAFGEYTVMLVADNDRQCPDTAYHTVRTTGVTGLFFPNALQLGAEGEAGLFLPKGNGLRDFGVAIFDEWGNIVWESSAVVNGSPAEGWDGTRNGKAVPQGSYVWRATATFVTGNEWKGAEGTDGKVRSTGTVTVLY